MYHLIDPYPVAPDISFWEFKHVTGKGIGLVDPNNLEGEFVPYLKGLPHDGVQVVKRGGLWYWVRPAYYNQSNPLQDVRKALAPLGVFTGRQMGLIANCVNYAHNKPSGLPAHNIMALVGHLYGLLAPAIAHLNDEQIKSAIDQYQTNMGQGDRS